MTFPKRAWPILLFLLAGGLVSCSGGNKISDPPGSGYSGIFGISYPPVGTDEDFQFTAGALHEDLGVNSLRFSAHWDLIQPEGPGMYNWNSFDKRMQNVRDNGMKLFLTVESKGPDWACGEPANGNSCVIDDKPAFRAFVTALLARHGDAIAFIQFGNEMLSPNFWAGTVEQFTELSNIFYDQVKMTRPDMPVVLGGFSAGVLRNFAACARGKELPIPADGRMLRGAEVDSMCATLFSIGLDVKVAYLLKQGKYDAIDLHLYDDPEYWPLLKEAIEEAAPGYPIMVSEFGVPRTVCGGSTDDCVLGITENEKAGTPYTEAYHAGRLATSMETLTAMQVVRAYHFKLVEDPLPGNLHDKSALYRDEGGAIVPKQPLIDVFTTHK